MAFSRTCCPVEQNVPSRNSSIDTEHGKLARRECGRYLAFAKNISDFQKTEEVLKYKVSSGTTIYQYEFDGVIKFWYNVILTPAVQKHEGIARVSDDKTGIQLN